MVGVRIEVLPGTATVAAALRRGLPIPCLPPLPGDAAAWSAAVEAATARCAAVAPALAERLALRQEALGAGPRAVANARALAETGTVAVVTGQQPGLLGGPLMTFHKAAGALHLADRLDAASGPRVVPVFWVASEDHDLEEVNRVVLLDRAGQVRKLSLDRRVDGRSLMHVPVGQDEADALLDAVGGLLPDTERARETCAALSPNGDTDVGTWGATSLLRLLGDSGLVIVEPEVLLPYAGDALAELVENVTPIRRAMAASAAALREAELPAPIEVGSDYAPLFVRDVEDGPRLRVTVGADGEVRVRGRKEPWTVAALADHLRRHPRRGGGDAAGRVFVQNQLLPVLAYVGGPTELAYHAQVCSAHAAVGREYPLAVPRPEATWVDAKAERAAGAFGLGVGDVLAAGPTEATPGHEDDALLEAALDAWGERAATVPPELEAHAADPGEGPAALTRAVRRLREAVEREGRAVRAAFARDRGTDAARWVRLQARLFPRGRSQERELSAVSVVARRGAEDFRTGLDALDPLVDGRYLIHLG